MKSATPKVLHPIGGIALLAHAIRAARETAERIEDSVNKSREGVVITQKVTTGFSEIATKAREVNGLVAQIGDTFKLGDNVNLSVGQGDLQRRAALDRLGQAPHQHLQRTGGSVAQTLLQQPA